MKRLADQTLYEVLEVPPDASAAQIQAAYDRARTLYGPGSLVTYTLLEPDEAAMLEARIEDARVTLLDPERRARYDEALREPEEARAVASGGAGPAVSAPSPVVPAAMDLPDASAPEAKPSRPTILLGMPIELGAAEAGEPPPPPGPILLRHAISPGAPAPLGAAPPAAAPADRAPPAPPGPMPDAWTGDALRQVRESRGLSVAQISERTKVTRHHIENIEADRFTALPAQVYLRGILLAVARELRLDGQKVARSYVERIAAAAGAATAPAKPR